MPTSKTVAIMQPYFIPYAGYFRLFAAVDLLVIYDCVQFPRRGWLHRNQLRTAAGALDWLTMPLEKAARDVPIRELAFRVDAASDLEAQLRRFPALMTPAPHAVALVESIRTPSSHPVDYIVELLGKSCGLLGLPWNVRRSSELAIPETVRAQERILAIATACGATRYINPPGGRDLYDRATFAAAGVELCFLTDFVGSYDSIAQRLAVEDPRLVASEIRGSLRIEH